MTELASQVTIGGFSIPLSPEPELGRPELVSWEGGSMQQAMTIPEATDDHADEQPWTPTLVSAPEQAGPLAAQLCWRVRREPYDEAAGGPCFVQAATLQDAVQLERVLEAYDDASGHPAAESDIQRWDGTSWCGLSEPAADTAEALALQVWAVEP